MKKRPLAVVCLIISIFLFLVTKLVKVSPPIFMEWEGKRVTVLGEVYEKESYWKADKEVSVVYLKLKAVWCNGEQAEICTGDYRAICYLKENQILPKTGSVIRTVGIMQGYDKATNPGQFDAESYYQILKISFRLNQAEIQQQSQTYHKIKEALYQIRCRCASVFDAILAPEDSSVMKTMLLGEKKAVDEKRKELYQKNGIAHILAISGLHISLIGMALFSLLRRAGLPSVISFSVPVMLIFLYGCMTGFSVSVIRAVGMFAIHMFGRLCKRTYDMVTAIGVMAVFILVDQPFYFYSSSFLLSFGCVLAIALLLPALTKKRLKKEKELRPWQVKIASGVSVTIAMLPLQMRFFYQVPLYSVLLNLLVIPLMSLLLPAGFLLLLVGNMVPLGGNAVGSAEVFPWISVLAELLINSTKGVIAGILAIYDMACKLCGRLPASLLGTGCPDIWRVICYFAMLFLIVCLQRKLSLRKKWMLVAGAVMLLMWPVPETCRVTFLDVGQGDCIHIQSRTGKHYLIDGGSSSVSGVGEYRILPYLKYRGVDEIEVVFVTHPDADHCNGILELFSLACEEKIAIRQLCLPDIGNSSKTEAYEELVSAAMQAEIPIIYFSKGMAIQDGELSLQCMHPCKGYVTGNENGYSLVMLMQYREFDALFTGDVEKEGEEELVQTLRARTVQMGNLRDRSMEAEAGNIDDLSMQVEMLKVAHHGSRYSTSEEFLSLIHPKIAVISCAEKNSYGHPHQETIANLSKEGATIMTTPDYGAITVEIGRNIRIYGYLK